MKLHDGKVSVSSPGEGMGCIFTVEIDMQRSTTPPTKESVNTQQSSFVGDEIYTGGVDCTVSASQLALNESIDRHEMFDSLKTEFDDDQESSRGRIKEKMRNISSNEYKVDTPAGRSFIFPVNVCIRLGLCAYT
jgi:hypothetical protein